MKKRVLAFALVTAFMFGASLGGDVRISAKSTLLTDDNKDPDQGQKIEWWISIQEWVVQVMSREKDGRATSSSSESSNLRTEHN